MAKKTQNSKAMSKPEIWIGQIPDIHGYGLNVVGYSEDEARKALKREFHKMQKAWNGVYSYPQAMENFGGRIFQIFPGKAYSDDFNE
jgi:hypothetical protein